MDMTGTQVNTLDGATKLEAFPSRSQKVYIADSESGPWRPIIESADDMDALPRYDVWHPDHLPDSTVEGDETDAVALERGRRVARERHREGSNYLFLDWHADYVATENMTINKWRDK
jgi:prepilin-type processing-associated H-X9-DG protein